MKRQVLTVVAAAAAAAMTISYSAIAKAADLDEPPIVASLDDTQFYVAARLGASAAEDTSFDLNAAAAVPTGINNSYDDWDIAGAAAFGFSYGNGFRAEIELGASQHEVEAHTIVALPATLSGANAFGDTTTYTALVNGYYDFDFGSTIKPYISAGIGYGHVDFGNHGIVLAVPTAGLPAGNVTVLSDSGGGFAWQVGVGAGYQISDGLNLELGYRYSGIEKVSLTAVDATSTDIDFRSHSIMTGIRVSF